jgi:two-component system, OmpR family, phosphate regulon sensor histidine kinase PhoR
MMPRSLRKLMAARSERDTPEPPAEPDLTQQQVLLARVLDTVPDAAIAVDGEDRVVALNTRTAALFPDLRSGSFLAHALRSPDVLDAVARARGVGPARASWLQRAPVERLFEVSAAPVALPAPSATVIVYLREMSETRRFERMRVDFVANASHELRTPLASLLGFIDTLQGPARGDEAARTRFLAIMREQALRMSRLVDDLLCLSRIEQHVHLQPKSGVDLAALIRHIADTLTPLALDCDVTLAIEERGSAVVTGDRDELMRVAENLIENAIKYGAADAADKRVLVTLAVGSREAVMAVRDFGAGIAPEHLPRLTERFYRVDAGQSRMKGGTGLGLALVKHVVARHRGRLTIESRVGGGSTFQVSLPLHAPTGDAIGSDGSPPRRHESVTQGS